MPVTIDYKGKLLETGIFKEPVNRSLMLSFSQLEGDGQGDMINHGGEDKAVCVYCEEHYSYWEDKLQRKLSYGAFGENFTVTGLLESDIHIGDIFAVGEAVVQVSQPRQPCFKLGWKHKMPELPEQVQDTGFTGYYFRVLKEGTVSAGDDIRLIERHALAITAAEANRLKYHDKTDLAGIHTLLAVEALADSWRKSFEKRLKSE
ncbi:MOSC domain-containing protein [Paenibacillus sp. LMG 31456]|uniref:MOSC domain-containing protein n=1 Tax=Paenibacillus foliorum TaxID=2654974 RepID=A0A972K2I2_9BACL|nr:MOSC domain-containing protein [Paenibacillus foliorum]NOU93892.1 MOSC domain-containing protein [Paenibacillus foliorum]